MNGSRNQPWWTSFPTRFPSTFYVPGTPMKSETRTGGRFCSPRTVTGRTAQYADRHSIFCDSTWHPVTWVLYIWPTVPIFFIFSIVSNWFHMVSRTLWSMENASTQPASPPPAKGQVDVSQHAQVATFVSEQHGSDISIEGTVWGSLNLDG